MRPLRKLPFVLLSLAAFFAPRFASAQIEDAAREAFTRMAHSLESASGLSVEASVAYDVMQPTGQLLQFQASNSVQLVRPDRLHATTLRKGTQREVWLRAGRLDVHDRLANTHGAITGPKEVDGMVRHLAETYGLSMPLADLLSNDIGEAMLDSALTGILVGTTQVEGVPCQHVAFTSERVDWQVWIETSERAVPRRLVITYKREPGSPQFAASLWDWNLEARLPRSLFQFAQPAGSQRVELVPLALLQPPNRSGRP